MKKISSIALILFFISLNFLFAQNRKVKTITVKCFPSYIEDTVCIYKEYSSSGKILVEKDNRYYTDIQYQYDNKNREISREGYYGESSNQVTTTYTSNQIIEVVRAGMFFSKTISTLDKNGNILNSEVFVSGNSNKSKENHTYKYNKDNKIIEHISTISRLDDGKEYDDMYEPEEKDILGELNSLKVTDINVLTETYLYDKNMNLIKHTQTNKEYPRSSYSESFEYNSESKIAKTLYMQDTTLSYIIDYKYEKNKDIITKTDYQYECTPKGRVRTESYVNTIKEYNEKGEIVFSERIGDGMKYTSYYENNLIKKEISGYEQVDGDEGDVQQGDTLVYEYTFW